MDQHHLYYTLLWNHFQGERDLGELRMGDRRQISENERISKSDTLATRSFVKRTFLAARSLLGQIQH